VPSATATLGGPATLGGSPNTRILEENPTNPTNPTNPVLPQTIEPHLSFSGAAAAFPIYPLEYRVPANLSEISVKKLAALLLTDGKTYNLTWRPVDDSRTVIKLVLQTAKNAQTYYIPAPNHISHLPMRWAKGAQLTHASIALLGPDNNQLGNVIDLKITKQTPEEIIP